MIKAGKPISIEIHSHSELVIVRPSGETETVSRPEKMNDPLFRKIKAATKAAGRGDVLSYTNHSKVSTYTPTAADEATDSTARIERAMRAGE